MLTRIRINIITALLLFSFFLAAMIPLCAKSQLWIDEVLDSTPAYNLAYHHKLSLDVWEGLMGVEKISFIRPPLHSLVLSYLYRTLGFKRWVTLGLPLVSTALTLVLIYFIAILLINDFWAATFSSILFGLSALGVNAAKWGRLNALAMFLFTTSFLLFLLARRQGMLKKYWLAFASAVFLGLSVQTYQLYGILFVSFVFYYLLCLRKEERKTWFREMLLYILTFSLTFALWVSFISKDIGLFRDHFVFVFLTASTIKHISNSNINIIAKVLVDFFWLAVYFPPLSLVFSVAGIVILARKSKRYRGILSAFVFIPALLLLFCGLFKGYYIEILTPLLFVSMGFYACLLLQRQREKKSLWSAVILSLFFLSHIAAGIGGRYFMTIKEWKKRNLALYEQELLKVIPVGSAVLGTAQDWYALNRSGSRLVLFEVAMFSPSWKDLDYIILSPFVELDKLPEVAEFIKKKGYEVARIGSGGHSYALPDGFNHNSGYSAVIFKIKK